MRPLLAFCLLLCLAPGALTAAPAPRPTILWIVCEDINPQLGCFWDKYAQTPHLDRFAQHALRYPH